MVANITRRKDGSYEGVFATPPWHDLGVKVREAPTSADAMRLSQLGWSVEQVDLVTTEGQPAMGWKLNRRVDNRLPLGIVGPNYIIVQNSDAFKFMDSLVENEVVVYESAFSLGGGKQVVLLIRMPKIDEIIAGDMQERFGLLNTSHDGSTEIRFGITAVRVCCQNTLNIAIAEGGIGTLRLRHTAMIHDKLTQARQMIVDADKAFEAHADSCRALAKKQIVTKDWVSYLDVVAPIPSQIDPEWTEMRQRRIIETRTNMDDLYRQGPNQQMDGVRGTAWAAYNAVSEYVDTLPRRGATDRARSEARFRVVTSGTGQNIKDRAFQAALRMAEVN